MHLDSSVINTVCTIAKSTASHNLYEAKDEPFALEWTYDSNGLLNQYAQPDSAPITAQDVPGQQKSRLLCAATLWTYTGLWKKENSTFLTFCTAVCTVNEVLSHHRVQWEWVLSYTMNGRRY
ncbi:hypothetical protein KIL84_012335 [Mauremys mutica]|uniref:Uncharacterized protein n=1 Tax=Mauremys mutica TaxID=74926 RepID=A0A9D4B1Z0_9SAUR|nr:hypothetical protein KIL84_012335 [Mauremys mutica]